MCSTDVGHVGWSEDVSLSRSVANGMVGLRVGAVAGFVVRAGRRVYG
jgi:hypothetical protein